MHLISNFPGSLLPGSFSVTPRWQVFLLVCINLAWAGDYFDPGFLGNSGDNTAVDLSAFSEAGEFSRGNMQYGYLLTSAMQGSTPWIFRKIRRAKLRRFSRHLNCKTFGVNVRQLPDLKDLPATAEIDNIGALIPQATTMLDLARLRLDISVPQAAMQPEVRGAVDPSQWEEGISA
ncbi:FimD/PapC N-terminal domain-containing protein [Klebsiella variicola]|uniref:FimD/PapC N-terminal domain-containing protein n=1 Tax=Klebsiella variicola TaxID=244366 RepID=UPI001E2FB81A|nr:FimD/PapC N-terminal domain-containing protein [Klebsiella variicola]UHD27163.1 FimD/PapC N-terminal domain-containing protein [Klebsiella variicola subsp. variicola]